MILLLLPVAASSVQSVGRSVWLGGWRHTFIVCRMPRLTCPANSAMRWMDEREDDYHIGITDFCVWLLQLLSLSCWGCPFPPLASKCWLHGIIHWPPAQKEVLHSVLKELDKKFVIEWIRYSFARHTFPSTWIAIDMRCDAFLRFQLPPPMTRKPRRRVRINWNRKTCINNFD